MSDTAPPLPSGYRLASDQPPPLPAGYSPQETQGSQDKGFWTTLGSDIYNAPKKFMDFATGHPVDDLIQARTALAQAREAHWKQAVEAYKSGDYKQAFEHAVFSIPVMGPTLGAIAEEGKTAPGEGSAHLLETMLPVFGPAAIDSIAANAPGALEGASNALRVTRGAVRGAVRAIPDALESSAAKYTGVPQLVRGAIKGAREVLATPEAAPPPVVGPPAIQPQATPPAYTPLRPPMNPPPPDVAGAPPTTSWRGPVRPPLATPPAAPTPEASGIPANLNDLIRQMESRQAPPLSPSDAALFQKIRDAFAEGQAAAMPSEPAESAIPWDASGTRVTRMPNKPPAAAPPSTPPAAAPEAPAPPPANEPIPIDIRRQLFDAMKANGDLPPDAQPGQPIAAATENTEPVPAMKRNQAAKGQRIAQALYNEGIGSDDFSLIPDAPEKLPSGQVMPSVGDVIGDLVRRGKLKADETAPNTSKREVLFYLQKLEKGGTLEPDAVTRTGTDSQGPAVSRSAPASSGPPPATPGKGATPTPDVQAAPGAAGEDPSATQLLIPGQDRGYAAHYQVRELSDVRPSHNGQTFQPNPDYELTNTRDYNNPENRAKVLTGSAPGKFNPAYHITDNPDATNGPVVIDPAGNAIGGNGRAMILQRVYASNPAGAAAYRDMLLRKAPQFGIDWRQAAAMKQPVLVRVVDDSELGGMAGKQVAVTDLNKVGTAALTPAERAIADSRRVSPDTLDLLGAKLEAAGSDATIANVLEGKSGAQVLNRLIDDGVISPQERAAYASGDSLTPDGKARISKLILGRFFRDPAQLDTIPASLRNKVEYAAAPLARVESYPAWNLSPTVHEAIDILEGARARGAKNLDDFFNQSGLFGNQEHSPQAVTLARAIQKMKPTEFRDAARQYAQDAKFAAEGPDMFGNEVKPDQSFADAFTKR